MVNLQVAALCAAFALGGCATNATHSVSGGPAQAKNFNCPTTTASRIPSNDKSCTAFGRSYSSEDLDQTGKTSAAEALQQLDPSITATH